jgi:SpoVK/Ycf46/Vps4 family AAA+-type ATPase
MKKNDKAAKLVNLSLVEVKAPHEKEEVQGYRTNLEHLAEEMKWLELKLRLQLLLEDKLLPGSGLSELALLDQDTLSILSGETEETQEVDAGDLSRELDMLTKRICDRVEVSLSQGVMLRLPLVSAALKLSPLEDKVIIACLAPELDRRFEGMYAFLQDDLAARSPTVDLMLRLFTSSDEEKANARLSFDKNAPLMRFLIETGGEWSNSRVPLIAKALKLEDWAVNHLLGFQVLDERLLNVSKMCLVPMLSQPEGSVTSSSSSSFPESIVRFANYYSGKGSGSRHIFYCCGPDDAESKRNVEAACSRLEMPLIIVDMDKMPASDVDYSLVLSLLGRHALLDGAALCLKSFDCLASEDDKGRSRRRIGLLLEMLCSYAPVAFILGQASWSYNLPDSEANFIQINFTSPNELTRKALWEEYSRDYKLLPQVNLEDFTDKFRFTSGQIRSALRNGENLAVWNSGSQACNHTGVQADRYPDAHSTTAIGDKELYESCYLQSGRSLQALAAKVKPFYSWDMMVLPRDQMDQLREICQQMKHRSMVYGKWGFDKRLSLGKGMNILFAGPPGVGKTMAAEVIAGELSLELYKIDVSQIVSKYIGETEKNLSQIFKEAETSNAILFFDEADALFGKRSEVKDAHDRYANVETSYLLQKMEEYTGIVILATNLSQNLDEAFLRRLHFRVEFPFPEKQQREIIWRGMFPKDAPLDGNLDYAFMAEKLTLAGGSIKNIALNAAFFAANEGCPIGMRHIMLAAKREYVKQGKTFLKTDYDPYYKLMEVATWQ